MRAPLPTLARVTLALLLLLAGATACTRADHQAGTAASGGQQAIQNKGSDTMVNLALAWAEAYRVHNADTRVLPLRHPAGPAPGAAPLPRGSPITIRGDVPYRCRAGGEAPERQKRSRPVWKAGAAP